jgi:hypothetical protein
VEQAVKQNGLAIQFGSTLPTSPALNAPLAASKTLRGDFLLCTAAVKQNGLALEFVNPNMKVPGAAPRPSWAACLLPPAPPHRRAGWEGNPELAMHAVRNAGPAALELADKKIQPNAKLQAAAKKQHVKAMFKEKREELHRQCIEEHPPPEKKLSKEEQELVEHSLM